MAPDKARGRALDPASDITTSESSHHDGRDAAASTIARPSVNGRLRLDLADRADAFGVLDLTGWRPHVPAGVVVELDVGAARRLTPQARQALATATLAARHVEVVGDDPVGITDAVQAVSGALRAVDSDRWPYNGPRRWVS